jgi:hypothetical protein
VSGVSPPLRQRLRRARLTVDRGAARGALKGNERLDRLNELGKAALAYFALVFGTGFALGLIRVPFLVPRIGERSAELLEMPFMLVAIVLAARFVVRRFRLTRAASSSMAVGAAALALLLAAEWLLGVWLQGRSFADYVADRDPVSGTVYALMLLVFALMPWLAARR